MEQPTRITILISGSGTNLQALIDTQLSSKFAEPVSIVRVISNRRAAYGLERAKKVGWMHIFSDKCLIPLEQAGIWVINLHPYVCVCCSTYGLTQTYDSQGSTGPIQRIKCHSAGA